MMSTKQDYRNTLIKVYSLLGEHSAETATEFHVVIEASGFLHIMNLIADRINNDTGD